MSTCTAALLVIDRVELEVPVRHPNFRIHGMSLVRTKPT
jgi:hypothetical protein